MITRKCATTFGFVHKFEWAQRSCVVNPSNRKKNNWLCPHSGDVSPLKASNSIKDAIKRNYTQHIHPNSMPWQIWFDFFRRSSLTKSRMQLRRLEFSGLKWKLKIEGYFNSISLSLHIFQSKVNLFLTIETGQHCNDYVLFFVNSIQVQLVFSLIKFRTRFELRTYAFHLHRKLVFSQIIIY